MGTGGQGQILQTCSYKLHREIGLSRKILFGLDAPFNLTVKLTFL